MMTALVDRLRATAGGGVQIDTAGRPVASIVPAPLAERNPLQRALDDYHIMERERAAAVDRARTAETQAQALLSETNMLREALERSDSDRIRLQAISSTLLGRLLAINDCIAGAVRASIKDGIEATAEAKADPELEQAATEVRDILQRAAPMERTEPTVSQTASPAPPQVDWRQLPAG